MGFKDEAREAFANLVTRVEALERLAEQVKRSGVAPVVARGEVNATPARSTLDYGAVAFGLSEIARKVKSQLGATTDMTAEYRGTVQYFADVFSKADPSFDEAQFKTQAGV